MIVIGPDGKAGLVEHVGFATLVQVQLMLENGTLASDVVPGYGALGSARTRADGVWGALTLRQLYAYVNENAAAIGLSADFKQIALSVILGDLRARRVSEMLVYIAFVLCYFRRRAVRRRTDAGVQREITEPLIPVIPTGISGGMVSSGENPRFVSFLQRLPFPAGDAQIVSVLPRYVELNNSFPIPPAYIQREAEEIGYKVPGTNRNAPPGPYTLRQGENSPILLPGSSSSPRTTPPLGQIVDGRTQPPQPQPQPPEPARPPEPTEPVPQPNRDLDRPANPGFLATSAATLGRNLPLIGGAILALGALAYVGTLLSKDVNKPPQRPMVPPPRRR